MPTQDGVGLHQEDGVLSVLHHAREGNHQAALEWPELGLLHLPARHDQLLAQQGVLGEQVFATAEQVCNEPAEHWGRSQRLARRRAYLLCDMRSDVTKSGCEEGEHALDLADARGHFKACRPRIPQRSCAGRAMQPPQSSEDGEHASDLACAGGQFKAGDSWIPQRSCAGRAMQQGQPPGNDGTSCGHALTVRGGRH